MKINSTLILITSCLLIFLLVSCESKEQKNDSAYDRFKKEKMQPKDSTEELVQITKTTMPVSKIKHQDEWSLFKLEIENKILKNEARIKEIKSTPNTNAKLLKKVTLLEKDNNDLRQQMIEYNDEAKAKWESFKTTINHNANEIDMELKDMQ